MTRITKFIGLSLAFVFVSNILIAISATPVSRVQQEPQKLVLDQDTTKKSQQIKDLKPYEADRHGDPLSNKRTSSPILIPNPSQIKLNVELDSSGEKFNISEKYESFEFRPNTQMPYGSYQLYRYMKDQNDYWKNLSIQQDGGDNLPGDDNRRIIPVIDGGKVVDWLFGGSTIDIQTSGNLVLDFGGLWQRVDNPEIPVRQQRVGGFNFDQQIGFSMVGQIGTKLQISANYDTKSTFDFQQQFNINYTAAEEDIVQDIQVGNVSFPVSNSLITGAQNLFGVYSKFRFGNLWVSSIFSSHQGATETIIIKNGAQTQEVELQAYEYDENRHFLLGQFFRGRYEQALTALPNVAAGIDITNIKVYVTNRSNETQNLRGIVALLDLGEGKPFDSQWGGNGDTSPSDNGNNGLYDRVKNLNRSSGTIKSNLDALNLSNGTEYEILTSARELDPSEYTIQGGQTKNSLGYISLKTPLRNDEMLAVSYEYSLAGKRYQVGELQNDINTLGLGASDMIFVKLLKPASIQIEVPSPSNPSVFEPYPAWDLMMKNIYSLDATGLQKDNFRFNVIYRNDATGADNPSIQNIPALEDSLFVRIFNIDQLDRNHSRKPDTFFDYVKGVTVNEEDGLLIFPVLEPFGEKMKQTLEDVGASSFDDQYVFSDLYDQTKADAQNNTTQNKYYIKGEYQSSTGGDIFLPGINISEGSVIVTMGGSPLTEGVQYSVDYQFGRVKILDPNVLGSNQDIRITYERADLFNVKTKNLVGVDLEYHFSPDFKITSTLLHLSENPLTSRVAVGSEALQNTMWGATIDYRSESRFLTKIVDALPGISTKEISNFTFKGEFAHLIPGTPKIVGDEGTAYIDDFEGSEISYNQTRTVQDWKLGSTPVRILEENGLDIGATELSANFKRAKIAWYNIDNIFYSNGSGTFSRPSNISDEDLANNYVRTIGYNEVFPGRDAEQISTNEISFDIAYYPEERGPYNYSEDVNSDGSLNNPEENYGALTRAIETNVDFENLNIQYIEFWLMDPFLDGPNGQIEGQNNTTGGKFYFNLGDVSEDVIPDGQHFFENGLSANADQNRDNEPWGILPNVTPLGTDAFNSAVPRDAQDVGLDGVANSQEPSYFSNFLATLGANLNGEALAKITEDPSSDNFKYYLDAGFDEEDAKILARYKDFNNPDGNSPVNSGNSNFPSSSTSIPDNEDLNHDNQVNFSNKYYEYELEFKPEDFNPNLPLSENLKFATDRITATVNGEEVNWYQFRIPVNQSDEAIGGIDNLKSVRFMRMYMTGWEQPVVLRMVDFKLVGAQWRVFAGNIDDRNASPIENNGVLDNSGFTVSSVNIEQNGVSNGETTPYTIPPGIIRDYDPTSTVTRQLNEQSIQLEVNRLEEGEGKAIYKTFNLDLINYERLKMEIHAEGGNQVDDDDAVAFIRLGSDYTQNYYEIEVPLKLTNPRTSSAPTQVWRSENTIDIELAKLVDVKLNRDTERLSLDSIFVNPQKIGNYTVSVRGRPDLSNVKSAMLGIRNNARNKTIQDLIVWFNELRVSGINTFSSWAANARFDATLADFADLSTNISYSTAGFGGIQDPISARQRSTNMNFGLTTSIQLDKLYLNRIGISLPILLSYQRGTSEPFYDPFDPDVPLDLKVKTLGTKEGIDYKNEVVEETWSRSISVSNFSKRKMNPNAKSYPWDIENLSLFGGYSDAYTKSMNINAQDDIRWNLGFNYTYTNPLRPWEPFKNSKLFEAGIFQLIKDFNIMPIPTSFNTRWDVRRDFNETQYRSQSFGEFVVDEPLFDKSFLFDRNYNLGWNFSNNLNLNYTANASSIIDEPLETNLSSSEVWKQVMELGTLRNYNQSISANYTVPFDKFPLTSFLSANAIYTADVNWAGAPEDFVGTDGKDLGNEIQNKQQIAVNGKVSMSKIYATIPYLQRLENAGSSRSRSGGKSRSRSRNKVSANEDVLQWKIERLDEKIKKLNDKLLKKKNKDQYKLEKEQKEREAQLDKMRREIEELKAKNKSYEVLEEQLGELEKSPLPTELKIKEKAEKEAFDRKRLKDAGEEKVEKESRLETKIAKLQKEKSKYEAEQRERRKQNKKPKQNKVLDTTLKFVTMLKEIDGSYTETNSTYLPGFLPTPKNFGMAEGFGAPGIPFILGQQNVNFVEEARKKGWVSESTSQNGQFTQTSMEEWNLRATIEPFTDFRIELSGVKQEMNAYSEALYQPDAAQGKLASRSGSYGVSFFSLPTAFKTAEITSETFDKFLDNRATVQQRLENENNVPSNSYGANSQDVLVPAFLAAYSGGDVNDYSLGSFPQLPIPGWNISYTGLSKLGLFKNVFSSVTLNHSYESLYNIGNYNSSLFYQASDVGLDKSVDQMPDNIIIDDETGNVVPLYTISQVTINERFYPLIGINLAMHNNWQFRFDYNKERNLVLNLTNPEVSERRADDYSVSIGYTKAGLKLPFRNKGSQIVLKNDLTFSMALTLRDETTYQRSVEDETTLITNGQKNFRIRPTLDYVLNNRASLQMYYEQSFNDPRISTSFRTSSTAFGFQFRYSLAQL